MNCSPCERQEHARCLIDDGTSGYGEHRPRLCSCACRLSVPSTISRAERDDLLALVTIVPRFNRFGPAVDYRGAHVLDADGKLAEIVDVVHVGCWMARLKRFNGEDAGEQTLSTLRILPRR